MGAGDSATFNVVKNLVVAAGDPSGTGFHWDSAYTVSSYSQLVSRVTGGGSNTAAFTVKIAGAGVADVKVEVFDSQPGSGSGSPVATFTASGASVNVSGVHEGQWVKVSSTTPFSSITYDHSTGTDYKLGAIDLQTANIQTPFSFTLPVEGSDRDHDTQASTITVNIPAAAAPVVLDLDGNGLQLVDHTAGAIYDYNGDGVREATAWIGRGDGFLVYDENGDDRASNASEFVFTQRVPGAATDLAAVRAEFDSNHDGKLTAADAGFERFGVWQDANGDGLAQAGEFKTLGELGIVSIDLVSDGKAYTTANGEAQVFGQASFTRADGTTGLVGDVALAMGTDPLRAAQQQLSTANTDYVSGLIAAGVAAAIASAPQGAELAETLRHLVQDYATHAAKSGAATSPLLDESKPAPVDHGSPAAATVQPAGEVAHSALAHTEPTTVAAMVDKGADAAAYHMPAEPAAEEAHAAPGHLQAAAPVAGGLVDASAIPMAALATHDAAAPATVASAEPAQAGEPGLEAQALQQLAHVLTEALGGGGTVDHLLASLPDGHGGTATLSLAEVDGAPQLILSDAALGVSVNLTEMVANHDAVALTGHV